jgi:hypothetical protein
MLAHFWPLGVRVFPPRLSSTLRRSASPHTTTATYLRALDHYPSSQRHSFHLLSIRSFDKMNFLQRAVSDHDSKSIASSRQHSVFSQQTLQSTAATTASKEPKPLYPVLNSDLNRPKKDLLSNDKNPLKRTASQVGGLAKPYSTTSSVVVAHGPSVLDQLHSALELDENCFPPDSELGLDDESPVQPSLPKHHTVAKAPVSAPAPPSSALRTSQVQWSSSPLEHKAPPPNAHLLHRPQAHTIDLTQEDPAEEVEETVERPRKRSALPWKKTPKLEQATSDSVVYPDLSHVDPNVRLHTAPVQRHSQPSSVGARGTLVT